MIEKGNRVTRTRAVKSKQKYNISIQYGSVYQDNDGKEYVSWSTVLKNLGDKIQKKEHIYFLNALKRGKIRNKEFFDNVFIPILDPMATLNCPVILNFTIKKDKAKKVSSPAKKKSKNDKSSKEEEFIDLGF